MCDDSCLDDLFHGCALFAFVEQARLVGDWPDTLQVRQRAYDLYENALSERSQQRQASAHTTHSLTEEHKGSYAPLDSTEG